MSARIKDNRLRIIPVEPYTYNPFGTVTLFNVRGLLAAPDGDEDFGAEDEVSFLSLLPPKIRPKIPPGLDEDVGELFEDDGTSNVPNEAIESGSGSFGSLGGS